LTLVGIIVVVVSEMALAERLEKVVTLHLRGERDTASWDKSSRGQPWRSVHIEAKVRRQLVWGERAYLARLAGNVVRNHQPVQNSAECLDLIKRSPVTEAAACQEIVEIYRLVEFGDLKGRQDSHDWSQDVANRVAEGLVQGRRGELKALMKMKLVLGRLDAMGLVAMPATVLW
jgi:cobalamin-dependent methionine synthase I